MKETKFKQTEVGMIPSDWKVKALNELCECNRSSTLSLPKEFVYVDLESVYQGKLLKKQIIKACDAPSRAQRFFEKGDILYQTVRPYQRNNLKVDFDAKNYIASTGYAVLHCKESLLNSDYLYQYIHTDRFVDVVMDNCSGTSYPAINPKTLMTFNIIIPSSFEEQQRIANALSDIDTLINNLEKLIAKKKNIKQGAMQQLLTGKKRLPGFAPAKPTYKQTELGKIPSDWKVNSLGSITQNCSYGVGAEAEPFKGGAKYIRITDIDDDNRRFTPSPLMSPAFYEEKHIVKENDLLIARTGASVGKTYLYDKNDGKLIFAGFLIKMNICGANAKFVFYCTQTKYYQDWIISESARTGQPGVNLQQMKTLQFSIPSSIEEQTAIANVLSDMDTEIATLETKLAKYRKLKTGMMQQLLTGKIRLVSK